MNHTPRIMSNKKHDWQTIEGKFIPFASEQQHWAWRCSICGMIIVEDVWGYLHDCTVGDLYTIGSIMPCKGPPTLEQADAPDAPETGEGEQ